MIVGIEVKDEYKTVGGVYAPTGEFRIPEFGEMYVIDGFVMKGCGVIRPKNKYPILKLKKWRAKWGCKYCFCTAGQVSCWVDSRDEVDGILYKIGNYYQTEELAQAAMIKILDIHKENL